MQQIQGEMKNVLFVYQVIANIFLQKNNAANPRRDEKRLVCLSSDCQCDERSVSELKHKGLIGRAHK